MNDQPDYSLGCLSADAEEFAEVLALRALAYRRPEAMKREEIDDYSLHFVARSQSGIVGALRVTCRRHGPLESEQLYPPWLLERFGDRMSGGSRLCVAPQFRNNLRLVYEIMSIAWQTILPLGVRIDVSKARLEAIPFYIRMGYMVLDHQLFEFSRWGVRCGILAYPASPSHRGKFAPLFRGIEDPMVMPDDLVENFMIRNFVNFKRFVFDQRDRRAVS